MRGLKVGLVTVAVIFALVCLTNQACMARDVFPAGDSLFVGWRVESSDTFYTITRIDELGDSLTLKVKMTVDGDGRNVAIYGPYAGLRANAWQFFGEHKLFAMGIRDTAMHERIENSAGGDGNAIVLTDSTWIVKTNDGILVRHTYIRYWIVGPSANNDTLHLDIERDILWRRNDSYALVRYKVKSLDTKKGADSLRFVFYGAPAMGYASGAHDVGYMPHYGEVRRDHLFSVLPSGPFAGIMNIGNKKAAGDTIADGTASFMDADSLKKDLGVGRSQYMVSFVAFNPNADIVPSMVAFDDSVDYAQRLPYDSTYTIADTTSAYDHANRYVIFRTDPVYLDGTTYQTLEYAVGIGRLIGETAPVRPTFPMVIYMDGTMYHPANTRRIWHD